MRIVLNGNMIMQSKEEVNRKRGKHISRKRYYICIILIMKYIFECKNKVFVIISFASKNYDIWSKFQHLGILR